jgi:1-acyl-sn-glycerol-3-phosphate acyltransferase
MLSLIRIPIALIFFLGVSLVGMFALLLRPFNPDNTRLFGRIFSWGGTRILGIKIHIKPNSQTEKSGNTVVIANHQHNLDLFVCGAVIPARTVSVGKRSLLMIPCFGLLYWLAGNILINRNKGSNAKARLSQTTEALTAGNRSIWFFPEGTRNGGNNILPFKKGAFRIAIEAGVPILPICVSSYAGKLNFNKLVSGTIYIEVLAPIRTDHMNIEDIEQLMNICWKRMDETINLLDKQSTH